MQPLAYTKKGALKTTNKPLSNKTVKRKLLKLKEKPFSIKFKIECLEFGMNSTQLEVF